ncbi:SDR family oxidoreductase [Kutzneria sp. NPDC051319]|uniref:SDR family NAD(P)-dependent oxidoreductase n=1 Tax=Kutzneria sp. NPDC051319 TaxID=3155047 RepID=UPI0034439843
MDEFAAQPFAGRTALITGAGRGIGREIALQLARAGAARLALLARTRDQLVETADLVARAGAEPLVVPVDLADRADRSEKIVTVIAQWATIDILINNAGVAQPLGPTAGTAPVLLRRAVDVNLTAPIELASALLPAMVDQKWGRVVNVSSAAASDVRLLAGTNAYVTTKAGLEAHTLNLAFELDGSGVTANVYRPGHVDTSMNRQSYEEAKTTNPQMFEFMDRARREGALLTPAVSAAVLLAHLADRGNGQIWHVDKTL